MICIYLDHQLEMDHLAQYFFDNQCLFNNDRFTKENGEDKKSEEIFSSLIFQVAVKVLKNQQPSTQEIKDFENEVQTMEKLKSPYVRFLLLYFFTA